MNPSRETKFSGAYGDRGIISAGNEQDWQPYPVDPYSTVCMLWPYTYIRRGQTSPGEERGDETG